MLERSRKESPGYWLQLMLAMGIASLGLVLGSGAVVIGAMLISPLMGPIVELGMGLAVGSPVLVMRSFARTGASIAIVIAASALLTLVLPYHEVTSEIAARTSPTLLDLCIAVLCAIAAAYTAAKPASDTTAAASGTAISIALVPPLCVIGYGIGAGERSISKGAGLLFTANLSAIVLFAVFCFLLLGYRAVETAALESAALDRHARGPIRRIAITLQLIFGSAYGPILRVIMPLLLVAGVYIPLRQALAEVTWQTSVRAAIQGMLAKMPESTVRSSISVERSHVAVHLVMLGRAEDAAKLQHELSGRIAEVAGVVPKVDVIAVPDSNALERIAASIKASEAVAPPVHDPDPALLKERLGTSLMSTWPKEAGALLDWHLIVAENRSLLVEALHDGPDLGAAGSALLGVALSRDLESAITVRTFAISSEAVVADSSGGADWLPSALRALEPVEMFEGLYGCIETPSSPKGKTPRDMALVIAALRASRAFEAGRLHIANGAKGWRAVVSVTPCAELSDAGAEAPDAAAADAGAVH